MFSSDGTLISASAAPHCGDRKKEIKEEGVEGGGGKERGGGLRNGILASCQLRSPQDEGVEKTKKEAEGEEKEEKEKIVLGF